MKGHLAISLYHASRRQEKGHIDQEQSRAEEEQSRGRPVGTIGQSREGLLFLPNSKPISNSATGPKEKSQREGRALPYDS